MVSYYVYRFVTVIFTYYIIGIFYNDISID